MTISPLLKNYVEKNSIQNSEHEKIYENLKNHANDVHPNAPKAKLIDETASQSLKSYFKDTAQDFANFATTVKTGKMSDNNIGRLNDLGMKIGGIAIASFLALHSKSKQESIMRFVGTGAFFASMKLWPKLFINLPAKIMHGVDPSKKYVTAQGDKKEFYLDNQFLPWDITDINDEKERRRHQKVALQNRTLWMATAGASVPLMTALISNRLEPVVARAIALGETFKVNHLANITDGIKKYLNPKKTVAQNEKEVADLCKQYANDPLNPEFAKKLKEYLRIDKHTFKDPDWAKPIKEFKPGDDSFVKAIKEAWKEHAEHTFTLEEFSEYMKNIAQEPRNNLGKSGLKKKCSNALFGKEDIESIQKTLFGTKTKTTVTYKDLEDALGSVKQKIPKGNEKIEGWLNGISWNNENFFATIKNYHKNFISEARTKVSKFLKLANPIVGETADSVYTNAYSRTMKNLFGKLNYSIDKSDSFVYKISDFVKINILHQNPKTIKATGHLSLHDIAKKDGAKCFDSIVDYFKALVEGVSYGSSEYESIIQDLTKTRLSDSELKAAKTILDENTIKLIEKEGIPSLDKAVFGEMNSSLTNVISGYVSQQKTNINAIISRLAVCANFEARLKEGLIQINGVDIRENSDILEVARRIIYNGNVNTIKNYAGSVNKKNFLDVVDAVYAEEAFRSEPNFVRESVAKLHNYIKSGSDFKSKDQYLASSDLLGLVKEYAARIYPSKTWLKKAGIAGAAIVAVTLLAQPLFGKIAKEFPKENDKKTKKEEKKEGVN